MNKQDLIKKIRDLSELTNEEKSELIELVNTQKRYGLVWEEKTEAVEEELREKLPVLVEVKEKRILSKTLSEPLIHTDSTDVPDLFSDLNQNEQENKSSDKIPNHILIEGDNLHALTALNYTHAGKIDVIYIDPPYNTGNKDFWYHDDYVEKEDSYRHSKWLSFMSKRLKLAKNLLKETGVIFLSIDDNEQAQLKLLCDEVFGEGHFAGVFPWKKRTTKSDVPFGISQDFEYVCCFANPKFQAGIIHSRKYFYTDDYPNDGWRLSDLTTQRSDVERPNSAFDLVNPKNNKIFPFNKHRVWSITKDTFDEYYKKGKIVFPGDYSFLKINIPAYRVFESEDKAKAMKKFGSEDQTKAISTLFPKEVGMNEDGNKEMIDLFGNKKFSFPKPTILIQHLLQITRNGEATILDFFAGSGTTLHATMQLNAEDGGSRQCILVTNNENNIAEEVCYERNKRIIQGYTKPNGDKVQGLSRNNFRYYKTDYVPSAKTEVNRRKLTEASTELLQIKEDCYTDITELSGFDRKLCTISTNSAGKYLIVIYHSRNQHEVTEAISDFIQKIPDLSEKVCIYAFGSEVEILVEDFYEVKDKINAVPLPDAIYNAYRATFRTLRLDRKKPSEPKNQENV